MEPRTVRYFRRILASNIVILAFGVVLSVTVYLTVFDIALQQVKQNQLSLLRQSSRTIDLYLSELDSLARVVANHRRLRILLAESEVDWSLLPVRLHETWDDLRYALLDSAVIWDALVFLRATDTVISIDDIFLDPQRHYGRLFGSSDVDYRTWRSMVFEPTFRQRISPAVTWLTERSSVRVVPIMRTIPMDSQGVVLGSIVFLVAEQTIRDLFASLGTGSSVEIRNEQNLQVISFGSGLTADRAAIVTGDYLDQQSGVFEAMVGGTNSIVAFERTPRSRLLIVASAPVAGVYRQIAAVRRFAFLAVFAFSAAGIAAGIILAKSLTRPFRELVLSNNRMAATIQETKPMVRSSILQRLLSGGFQDQRELASYLADLDLPVAATGYRVVVVRLVGYRSVVSQAMVSELHAKRAAVMRIAHGLVAANAIVFSFGDDTVRILHWQQSEDTRRQDDPLLRTLAATIRQRADDQHISLAIGIGGFADRLVDLKRSLDGATAVLEYVEFGGCDPVLFEHELPHGPAAVYYYPLDVGVRLENAVRTGHRELVTEILDDLYQRNFVDRNIGVDMLRQLLSDLRGAYLRVLSTTDLGLQEQTNEFDTIDFRSIADAFRSLADHQHSKKRSHNDLLREQIVDFVTTNNASPNLSVTLVADQFRLSEDYLSHFFREQVGVTFSSFVEGLRLDRAERLLQDRSRTIDDVAAACGYANSRSLRRAYQRRFGINPSQNRR